MVNQSSEVEAATEVTPLNRNLPTAALNQTNQSSMDNETKSFLIKAAFDVVLLGAGKFNWNPL